jgi:MGT family glycosyltransferase
MATVVIVNVPAQGHIAPTLPVTRELVRRGERVFYYCYEEYRGAIESTGARFRAYRVEAPFDHTKPASNPVVLASNLWQATAALLPTLVPQIEQDGPDYIVHDSLCPWGKAASQILCLPSACSISTFALSSRMMLFSGGARDLFPLFLAKDAWHRYRTTAKQLGTEYPRLRPRLLDALTCTASLNLVHTSASFQPFANSFSDRYRFVGRTYEEPDEVAGGNVDCASPLIYVSLGTIFNDLADFYKMCFDAFGSQSPEVLISCGTRIDVETLGPIPSNIKLQPTVPQLAVLQRASAFVSHAGMNSVQEALHFGVPLVCVPQAADQHIVAKQIEALGAGVALRRDTLSPARLGRAVEQVLSDSRFRTRSAHLGRSIAAGGGHVKAVDELQAAFRANIRRQVAAPV